MTRESSLWKRFKEALPPEAHSVRVENSVERGTPDVNVAIPYAKHGENTDGNRGVCAFCAWVELKVQAPPKRASTRFKIGHFTMEQRQWLNARWLAGQDAYMLLQVNTHYLWLPGHVAAVWVGFCTLKELEQRALWVGGRLEDLIAILAN